MTKIFYLVVASLTLLAAAVQWLPKEGLSPNDLNFVGPDKARAQSPAPFSSSGVPATSAPPAAYPAAGAPPAAYTQVGSQQPAYSQSPPQPTQPQPVPPVYTASQNNYAPQGFGTPNVAPNYAPTPPISAAPVAPQFPATAASFASTAAPPIAPPNVSSSGVIENAALAFPTQELEGTKVLARVGGDTIFAGEVLSSVNSLLARSSGMDIRNPELLKDPAFIRQRDQWVKARLQQVIETRIIVNEAKRKIPKEGYEKAMAKFFEEFDKTVLPQMLKERKFPDLQAYEAQLRKEGTTLEREKNAWAESVLRSSWINQTVKSTQEVTHMQMLDYYQKHATEYDTEAYAKWEQITIRFDRTASKEAAYAEIAKAGNRVIDGEKFEDVAKQVSHGSTASIGGEVNWTKKGSLVSQPIDAAVFSLPEGQMSPIIEDDRGFHIVRVLDRREAGRKPFKDVQAEIRKKINEERTVEAKVKYVEDLKKKTVIWTIYDEEDAKIRKASGDDRYDNAAVRR